MSLLDGIAATIFAATNDVLMSDVLLHRADAGGQTVTLRGLVGSYNSYRANELGIPDSDMQITALQANAPASPRTGDELTARGRRFLIVAVAEDPAAATWEIQARPVT